jgi:hypothetical protein
VFDHRIGNVIDFNMPWPVKNECFHGSGETEIVDWPDAKISARDTSCLCPGTWATSAPAEPKNMNEF